MKLLELARRICPEYANGEEPTPQQEIERLLAFWRVRVMVKPLDVPAVILPPFLGDHILLVDPGVHRATRDGYILRHELGHVLAEDAAEPTILRFTYPLPEAEMVSDVFAFLDLITHEEIDAGSETIEARLRELVVLDHRYWYLRVPRIAEELIAIRGLLKDWEG